MDDLVTRLRSAIDEAERIALTAVQYDYGVKDWAEEEDPVGIHIALHDPERELRMVAAHRKLVGLHAASDTAEVFGEVSTITYCPVCYHGCPTLDALAEGYGIVAP